MKKILIFVILIFLISCKKTSTSPKEMFFSINDLSKLDLINFESFWQGDSVTQRIPQTFDNYEGYLGGLELSSEEKMLYVYVFETKEIAITSTEEFLLTISMYTIEAKNHNIIEEKWWHTPNSYNTIFVNKYNVIICVHSFLEQEENYTQNIAIEIMNRIEKNCE